MKPAVTAIVIAHDQPEFLNVTLLALQNQSLAADQIIVVDTSVGEECQSTVAEFSNLEYLRLSSELRFSQILNSVVHTLSSRSGSSGSGLADWLWLIHDDSAPEKAALEQLLLVTEKSPSVALVGPKQLDWHNPREILQMGLTLAPSGEVFSLVSGELDQAQHDEMDDVLALGTAGLLLKSSVYQQLDGFDPKAPELAADVDFAIRARLAGHRVVVAPKAKVLHAGLALAGKRPRKWLRVAPKTARRRASLHLQLAYLPLISSLLLWVALPLVGLARALVAIAKKRPDLIIAELGAAAWAWFTLPMRLTSRSRIRKVRKIRFSKFKALRATRAQVRANRNAQLDTDDYFNQLESSATSNLVGVQGLSDQQAVTPRSFISSGAGWLMLALLLGSFAWWPRDQAGSGGGLLPLSQNWLDLFNRAGASFQNIGIGYFAPSDPFVWVLTALGATTFWAPSLSTVLLLLLAKPLAFLGAWRLAAAFTGSSIARNIAALTYALWPMATVYQGEVRLPVVIAFVSLPWFALAISRVANLVKFSSIHSKQLRATWVAVAGLLLAIITASSPMIGIISLVALAVIAIIRIRQIGFLIWVPLPTAAIFGPTVLFYLTELGQPLALLADPGLPQGFGLRSEIAVNFFDLITLNVSPVLPTAILVGLAFIALLTKRVATATSLWLFILLLAGAAWLIQKISLPAVGVGSTSYSQQTVPLSTASVIVVIGLLVSLLVAMVFDSIQGKRMSSFIAVTAAMLAVIPAAAALILTPNPLTYSSARAVPSIVEAETKMGSALKVLSLHPDELGDGSVNIAAELVNGDGVQLEDVSLSYRFAVAKIASTSPEFQQVSQLVADLASANDAQLSTSLNDLGIGYILITNPNDDQAITLAYALDSAPELEAVGLTDFGQLWRVRDPNLSLLNAGPVNQNDWSITKGVQLAVLISFGLLALPSRPTKRRPTSDSEIFVDETEDAA